MRVVIVGGGSLGARTARLLVQRGYEVVVIESDEEVAQSISESLDCGVIHGDGTRPAVISEADPSHADALLALTGNAQTNLIASLIGGSAGFPRVITRIDDEEFEHIAIELGLELSGAIKGDARVFLFAAREEDEGTVAELELPEGARVSHLYRDGELVFGDTDLRLRKGDEVVIVTHQEHLADLRSRWAPKAVGRRH
jgi:trk system potassium uptake protein TrkA